MSFGQLFHDFNWLDQSELVVSIPVFSQEKSKHKIELNMQKGIEWQIQEQLEEMSHYVVLDHTLVNLVNIQLY